MRTLKLNRERMYIGVDVGGTKIQASVVSESGAIVARLRCVTPRVNNLDQKGMGQTGPEQVLAKIEEVMGEVLTNAKLGVSDISAIGIAIPGVVDPKLGRVVVTPNMSLTGVAIGAHLQNIFHVPVAIGNDGNMGTYGEAWLGSARKARSALGIWVGTGIGAGLVYKGRMWRGARESAGEIGHIVMQIGGPKCGCGNCGCLEALASRTAIERDIREGIASGRKSMLTELAGGDLSVIRSGAIKKALKANDELVTEVVHRASEVLAHACLTVRHLVDPEVIVLGGGLVEACSDYMMPILENIVGSDRLPGARDGGHILLSALGDDAVVLGAVALARKKIGRSPFKRRFHVEPTYPEISRFGFGEVVIGQKTFKDDVYITVSGKVKTRDMNQAAKESADGLVVGVKELADVCKGGPEVLFIATDKAAAMRVSDSGQRFLSQRSIHCEFVAGSQFLETYNKSKARKATLIHVL